MALRAAHGLIVPIAQAAPDLQLWLQIVNTGGVVGILTVIVFLFVTGRLVPGAAHERVIAERDTKDEQVQLLHKESQAVNANIQDKVIPALVEATLALREKRHGA